MADYLIEFGGKIVNKLWTTLFGLELNFFSNVGKTKKRENNNETDNENNNNSR